MNIAIVGSRSFDDYELLVRKMEELDLAPTRIISGGASGADALAARFAKEQGLDFLEISPQWSRYGRAAGMVRNREIVDKADVVVAFWNGASRGTANTIELARKEGKKVIVVEVRQHA